MKLLSRTLSSVLLASFSLAAATWANAETSRNSAEDQRNLISGLCTTQLADLGASGCTCLAGRALDELNDDQRAYLILSVVQPQAAEKMPIAQSKEELAAIFNFLGTAHTACSAAAVKPGEAATPEQPAAGQSTQQ